MGEVQTFDKSHHSLSGLNLSLLLRLSSPIQSVHLLLAIAERAGHALELDTDVAFFVSEDAVEECLAAEPALRIANMLDADAIRENTDDHQGLRARRAFAMMRSNSVSNVSESIRNATSAGR